MLSRIDLCGTDPALTNEARALTFVYPWLLVVAGVDAAADAVAIPVARWSSPDFDPFTWDRAVGEAIAQHGSASLRIEGSAEAATLGRVALEATTRFQRFITGRNCASADPVFDRALGLHRALHDRRKPLVAADHDHAIDTWRWVLRLEPGASLAVQLAALYHDVERLDSESERRIEQHSRDYHAFKEAHAAGGARLVARLLATVAAGDALIRRVVALVREHEHGGDDAEMALLNEADALSFFSLNACGFRHHYGLAHTERKVAYTLARLGPRGQRELGRIRHRDDLRALIDQALRAGR